MTLWQNGTSSPVLSSATIISTASVSGTQAPANFSINANLPNGNTSDNFALIALDTAGATSTQFINFATTSIGVGVGIQGSPNTPLATSTSSAIVDERQYSGGVIDYIIAGRNGGPTPYAVHQPDINGNAVEGGAFPSTPPGQIPFATISYTLQTWDGQGNTQTFPLGQDTISYDGGILSYQDQAVGQQGLRYNQTLVSISYTGTPIPWYINDTCPNGDTNTNDEVGSMKSKSLPC